MEIPRTLASVGLGLAPRPFAPRPFGLLPVVALPLVRRPFPSPAVDCAAATCTALGVPASEVEAFAISSPGNRSWLTSVHSISSRQLALDPPLPPLDDT